MPGTSTSTSWSCWGMRWSLRPRTTRASCGPSSHRRELGRRRPSRRWRSLRRSREPGATVSVGRPCGRRLRESALGSSHRWRPGPGW
ncbi:hypothetical protein ACFPRL_18470 [Pseudoclavibacter helvolus]